MGNIPSIRNSLDLKEVKFVFIFMKLVQIVGLRLRPFILMQILKFPLLLDTNIFTHLWRLNLRSCTSCEVIGSFCLTH